MNSLDAPSSQRPTPTPTDGYEALPETIRRLYTPKQYAWLMDCQRVNLLDSELEPQFNE